MVPILKSLESFKHQSFQKGNFNSISKSLCTSSLACCKWVNIYIVINSTLAIMTPVSCQLVYISPYHCKHGKIHVYSPVICLYSHSKESVLFKNALTLSFDLFICFFFSDVTIRSL